MTGRQFGQYRLETLIGTGGMGEVFRAYDTRRSRSVAVKLLLSTLSDDNTYQRRFRQESYIAASLREPHIIPIHDFGEIEGQLFIDMRLVDGESINSILKNHGPIPPERAVGFIGQIAQALDAAHADGLVHRDIKPSNILVTRNDFIYVVDFGIAHTMGSTSSTRPGTTILGTLDYMAPERFGNRHIDGRVDVYSLTCLLYECITAYRPFSGRDLPSLMYAHLFSPPPRPSEINPNLPAGFDAVIAHGMAKDPDARFDTATKLADAARDAIKNTWTGISSGYRIAGGEHAGRTLPPASTSKTSDALPQPPRSITTTVTTRRLKDLMLSRLKNLILAGGAAVAVSIALISALSFAFGRQESDSAPTGGVNSLAPAVGAADAPPAAPNAASPAPLLEALTPMDVEIGVAAVPNDGKWVTSDFTTGSIAIAPNGCNESPVKWASLHR
ncbi:MAG: serine/threonine-protein kinase [Pseudonocardiaceae bacterium]